ncbi:unnamed protein product, partial [Dicrocoelium dendriticum]
MTFSSNINFILHRPSRRLSRVALSAAYSRADKRKHATAGASLLSFPPFSLTPIPAPITNLPSIIPSLIDSNRSATGVEPSAATIPQHLSDAYRQKFLIRPRCPVTMATFNVRTLRQTGQQAALARTLDTLDVDVCCVSETRINDPNGVIELTAPGLSSRYWLHASGD